MLFAGGVEKKLNINYYPVKWNLIESLKFVPKLTEATPGIITYNNVK